MRDPYCPLFKIIWHICNNQRKIVLSLQRENNYIMTKIVAFGSAHLGNSGNSSPDNRIVEAVYSREMIRMCQELLEADGYQVLVDYEPLKPAPEMQATTWKVQQSRELAYRVNKVNEWCEKYGKDNIFYVSLHCDAAAGEKAWHNAGGVTFYTSRGQTDSDVLAECLYKSAERHLIDYKKLMEQGKARGIYSKSQTYIRIDMTDGDHDREEDYYVLKHTKCAACLVEMGFQDNKWDVDYMLSEAGRYSLCRMLVDGIMSYAGNIE